MSKTSNKKQIEMLVDAMQGHPDIACGFWKKTKEDVSSFWENLGNELNSAGPPSKTVSEWKKVWADQKKYVRHKASKNLKASRGTGAGPNVEAKFSATEEAIFNLVGMKESVEGVANTFGLGPSKSNEAENIEAAVEQVLLDDTISVQSFTEVMEDTPIPPLIQRKRKTASSELLTVNNSTADIFKQELSTQKEIRDALQDQQQNTKKIYRSIDRLYDLKKHHYEVMEKANKDELEELKRHNLVMEMLRLRELEEKAEKTRRLLEIEDLKQKIHKK